jgi:hypothetical protein
VVDADDDASLEPKEDDDLELTAEEMDSDRLLAVRTVWASLTGYAAWIHPPAGAALAALTPISDKIATFAVKKLGKRRIEHAAETLLDAADAAGEPLSNFVDRAVADDRRHELFARTLTIAQDTALRNKRRALGRALAAGVMGDDARIDEELLFIKAVADIDEMHIRVLARMREAADMGLNRQNPDSLRGADPGLGQNVEALLATLQLHALVAEELGEPQGPFGYQRPYLVITDTGRAFLDRLADDSDSSLSQSAT